MLCVAIVRMRQHCYTWLERRKYHSGIQQKKERKPVGDDLNEPNGDYDREHAATGGTAPCIKSERVVEFVSRKVDHLLQQVTKFREHVRSTRNTRINGWNTVSHSQKGNLASPHPK